MTQIIFICTADKEYIQVKVILAVMKQLKQLQRKTRNNFEAPTGFKPMTSAIDPLPARLHSSVGRASHRYREGHGFESHWSLRIFSGLYF